MAVQYFFVGLGGALGAMARLALIRSLPQTLFGIPFPIFLINCIGCFTLGFLIQLSTTQWPLSEEIQTLLIPGVLGGFAAYGAFIVDFTQLYEKQAYLSTAIYVVGMISVTTLLFFIGMKCARVVL